MKHLVMIAIAFLTLNNFAQEKQTENKTLHREKFTAEQIAELQTKRMVLDLDLNASQKQKIQALNLANAQERQAKKEASRGTRKARTGKRSSEDRFKLKSERLDKALAHKTKMKSILSKEQFATWEKGKQRRGSKARMGKRKELKQRSGRKNRMRRHSKKEK